MRAKPPRSRRPATTEAELFPAPDPAPNPGDDPRDDEADLEPETGPLRRCVVTRERQAKERMIRFVLGPDRMVVPDVAARLPGRGIWLSARLDVLETARAQGSLARAFAKQASKGLARNVTNGLEVDPGTSRAAQKASRGQVTLPPDLADLIEAMLLRRVVELLGLARRAGQAVCGFQKAREWLTSDRAGLVVQASDGSVDERARFLSGVTTADLSVPVDTGPAASNEADPDGPKARPAVPVGSPLPAATLGAVFGREHGVHVVVAPGRLAEALTNEIARFYGVTRRDEPGRVIAKAGLAAKAELKAAGGDAGKIEAGRTGSDREMNERAGA